MARRQDRGQDLGAKWHDRGARRQDRGQVLVARRQDLEERSWGKMPRIWPPNSWHLDLGHDLAPRSWPRFFRWEVWQSNKKQFTEIIYEVTIFTAP